MILGFQLLDAVELNSDEVIASEGLLQASHDVPPSQANLGPVLLILALVLVDTRMRLYQTDKRLDDVLGCGRGGHDAEEV